MTSISAIAERIPTSGISPEARRYAVKELARRAGVTAELFQSWRIEPGEEVTTVFIQPGTDKRIRFRHARSFQHTRPSRSFHTARASWWQRPDESVRSLIPDFLVPFSEDATHRRPLFAPGAGDSMECDLDLLCSVVLTLTRWEECLPGERDVHERFPSSQSVAVYDQFLHRPIVDEYGFALEQALRRLLPGWRPAARTLRVKVSHDVDVIGIPFNFRTAVGHTVRRRNPTATIRDLLGRALGLDPAGLGAARRIAQLSLNRGIDCAMYWMASPRGAVDSGYDPRHPKVRATIAWLREHGVELGVHPGYDTFGSPAQLARELKILREVLGTQPLGGRQHYLRWSPDTWIDWETCGLAYDSTLGYADRTGFRAGTCIPYRPWLLSLNREARLIEIPLIVMEETLLTIAPVPVPQRLEAVLEHLPRCRLVGGVFALLWHNGNVIAPDVRRLYAQSLDALRGYKKFDWRTPSGDLY